MASGSRHVRTLCPQLRHRQEAWEIGLRIITNHQSKTQKRSPGPPACPPPGGGSWDGGSGSHSAGTAEDSTCHSWSSCGAPVLPGAEPGQQEDPYWGAGQALSLHLKEGRVEAQRGLGLPRRLSLHSAWPLLCAHTASVQESGHVNRPATRAGAWGGGRLHSGQQSSRKATRRANPIPFLMKRTCSSIGVRDPRLLPGAGSL